MNEPNTATEWTVPHQDRQWPHSLAPVVRPKPVYRAKAQEVCPVRVLQSPFLTHAEKALFMMICHDAYESGYVEYSYRTLANRLEKTYNEIRWMVSKLERVGVIKTVKRASHGLRYYPIRS